MITDNPTNFWNKRSVKKNWREYILPRRTNEQFDNEGKQQAEEIQKFIMPGDTVLEFGSGVGRILKHIRAKKKIGVDICENYLKKAKKDKTSEYLLDYDGKADFIYSISVFQHNNKTERIKILRIIQKYLNKGGRTLISFPHEKSLNYKETPFVHKFTKKEVEEYGKLFSEYQIIEGNLVNYGDKRNGEFNEYFLLAVK